MNFYYDPILGLQYNYLGELILIDIETLPQDIKFDTEKWMRYIREVGLQIFDTTPTIPFENIGQITNYMI